MIDTCCGIALVRGSELEIKEYFNQIRELFWANERSHDSPNPKSARHGWPQGLSGFDEIVDWMTCLQCEGKLAGPNRSPAFSNYSLPQDLAACCGPCLLVGHNAERYCWLAASQFNGFLLEDHLH